MNLSSLDFFLFLGVVLLALRATGRFSPLLLLLANYLFYASWNWAYLPLILATSAVDYICARKIEGAMSDRHRRIFLWLSLGFNLSLLIYFKYAFRLLHHFVDVTIPLIPIGLSFHAFQSMGYVLDVYRKRLPAEKNFIDYANFVSFFPQLIAGPIERAGHMLPQLKTRSFRPRAGEVGKAFYLIFLGLFMTLALGENIAGAALSFFELNATNAAALGHTSTRIDYLFSIYAFPFTLYLRFAGYSYLAQGAALLLGIDLSVNFRYPFFSKSMAEFWGRWHISLSKWIRDYVFLPLSARAKSASDLYAYIFITMWLFGLWHQASLGWLIASTILASYSVLGHILRRGSRPGSTSFLAKIFWTLLTFHIFAFAMIFVNNLTDERNMGQLLEGLLRFYRIDFGRPELHHLQVLKFIGVAIMIDAINFRHRDIFGLLKLKLPYRIALFSFMILFMFFNVNLESALSMYFRM